jgi:nitrogenase-associated protein
MSQIVFYEKPGCIGNQRQKILLRSLGYSLEVRDLLRQDWNPVLLRTFFGDKPVQQWFNQSAPAITSGQLDIESMGEEEALALMQSQPILICRPLLEYGDLKQSGFVSGPVLAALAIRFDEDLQTCPMTEAEPVCAEPV